MSSAASPSSSNCDLECAEDCPCQPSSTSGSDTTSTSAQSLTPATAPAHANPWLRLFGGQPAPPPSEGGDSSNDADEDGLELACFALPVHAPDAVCKFANGEDEAERDYTELTDEERTLVQSALTAFDRVATTTHAWNRACFTAKLAEADFARCEVMGLLETAFDTLPVTQRAEGQPRDYFNALGNMYDAMDAARERLTALNEAFEAWEEEREGGEEEEEEEQEEEGNDTGEEADDES